MRYIDKQKSILVFGGWTLKAMRLKQFFGIASTTLLLIIWQTFPVNISGLLGNYPKAIEYHQQYLVLTREIEDRLSEGFALWYLGNAYNSLRDYTKANDYYQQSLVIARETKNSLLEGLVQKSLVETQN
ncbi:tetratricopeptide repeat protein [Floridanema evergladense]|uniref:Tetratricopeptide repeat protein n=1 Tax=Floridaenema evergladense BLCC-F167 TaxID=3153639 RepID=A0ABV4WDY5_9CYAN